MYEVDFNEKENSLGVKVNVSYPYNPEYDYVVYMERLNLDKEKEKDLQRGKGFIISSPKATLKKDIKNPDGIFSTRFGQRLGDQNPFMDKYSCRCGNLKGVINDGIVCDKCQHICKFVDDDFSIFGWIEIDKEYAIIHPDLYMQLDSFFGRSKIIKDKKTKKGSVLYNMLDFDKEMDSAGYIIGYKNKPNEPFYGIGMIEFYHRFDEIMEYYYSKNKKTELYEDIMADRDKVFTNSIPVYTTLLRPMDIAAETMYFEKTNGYFNMMVRQAQMINKNKRKIDRMEKQKNIQLFKLQSKYMVLYQEIVDILNGKKGELRNLISGRFNYSSRSVIKQNPNLRIDQVELPYVELVITEQQRIMNILHKTLNITLQEAYDKWFKAISTVDPIIVNILNDIIKASGEGIPVI